MQQTKKKKKWIAKEKKGGGGNESSILKKKMGLTNKVIRSSTKDNNTVKQPKQIKWQSRACWQDEYPVVSYVESDIT